MSALDTLKNLVLAPYILKSMALIPVGRRVGGNQFRHAFSTLGILLDYGYFNDSVLLKASLVHDLFEDLPHVQIEEVRRIDQDGPKVVDLVLQVTKRKDETKPEFLARILSEGSNSALLLKCADRISNLTDLNRDTQTDEKIADYLDQTEQYVIKMAEKVNAHMVTELTDLVKRRREILDITEQPKRQ
jgi:GTP pyrophosphokinase